MTAADVRSGPVLFVYWGRRGALNPFTLALCEALARRPELDAKVSVSTANEVLPDFRRFGELIVPFETFRSARSMLLALPRGWRDMGALVRHLRAERYRAVVVLMPHMWTPLFALRVKASGIRYGVVVHDADPHPGDRTALVNPWLLRDAALADAVITLSGAVRDGLIVRRGVPAAKITALFHPLYGQVRADAPRQAHRPFRFLFLGRIAHYKGVALLLETAEMLRAEGVDLALTIAGEGSLGREAARAETLGATVLNRWLGDDEIDRLLAETDAVVLPYLEASQSGVAALARSRGIPVIATPVGGLAEQVAHERTGLIAQAATAEALASAMRRLVQEAGLYARLAAGAAKPSEERSMDRFLDAVLALARGR